MLSQINEMISSLEKWLKLQDYNYIECNHVPDILLGKNRKLNILLRTFFRLYPYNLRKIIYTSSTSYPITPQSNVILLKAYAISNNKKVIEKLYKRVISLRSPKTKHFALKQGIKIAINLYENSADDPTPLNTVWFGQFLLEENSGTIQEKEKKELLYSIATYLTEELGYTDHNEQGVYFYYGPTLKKEIYNASAIISAFLIKFGIKYNEKSYLNLGQRGIKYICNKQNKDGSWFYAGMPERSTIDNFHQSYILQALCSVKEHMPIDINKTIEKGVIYYRTRFIKKGQYIIPLRYDKRYTPHNTWILQKIDGRDITEALIFFTKYEPDEIMVKYLITYIYDKFYNKKKGYLAPEFFIYGKNRIPYIEFQAWFLYALQIVKNSKK